MYILRKLLLVFSFILPATASFAETKEGDVSTVIWLQIDNAARCSRGGCSCHKDLGCGTVAVIEDDIITEKTVVWFNHPDCTNRVKGKKIASDRISTYCSVIDETKTKYDFRVRRQRQE